MLQEVATGTEPARAERAPKLVRTRMDRLLETLPAGVYFTDRRGRISYYNRRAVQLWGREPRLNDHSDLYCGSYRLYSASTGLPVAHDQCWLAQALKNDREYHGEEIVIERPDGQRRVALAYATPLRAESGAVSGAMNILIDITERKQAEERLQLVLHSIEDHLVTYDREWRYSFVSDRGAALLGRKRSELLGQCVWDVLPELVGTPYHFELQQALSEHRTIRAEHYDASRDRWFENTIHPLAEGVAVYAADITWRKLAERALQRSEERYRTLIGACSSIVWCADPAGALSEPQDGWERYTGQPWEEHRGAGWLAMLHPEDRERIRVAWTQSMASGAVYDAQLRIWHAASASYRDHEVRVVPLREADGGVREWVGVCTDVTERRRAEQLVHVLLQLSQKLNATLDLEVLLDTLVQQAMALVGAQGGCAGVRTPEGMLSQRYFTTAGPVALQCCWREGQGLPGWLIRNKRPYLTNDAAGDPQFSYAIWERFGVWCALSTPMLDAAGEVIGFFQLHNKPGGFRDGDRELLLAVSRAASIAMQNALIHRKVLAADEALRIADRRKDDFLAVLAHELRNPLAPIANSLRFLQFSGTVAEAGQPVLELMERQVRHLVRLVDDLLEVSRITSGLIELKREPVDIALALRAACDTSRPLIDAAGHRCTLQLPDEVLLLDGDPVRITQIFANLLNNAAKYTPPGGEILLDARRDAQEVVIMVRDNGHGISAEQLPRIFEMFMRGGRSLAAPQGGLGVGLSLVQSLVQLHGGTVCAHSEGPGCGSEFTVRLPLSSSGQRLPQTSLDAQLTATAQGRRVLAVDDNRDAADSLGWLLRTLGAEAQVAYDGPTALQLICDWHPELVLLDVSMPGMDGLEVAKRVRSDPTLADVMLVALTGGGLEDDRRRSQEAGFDRHLVKPVDLGNLGEVLQDAQHAR